MAKMRRSVTEIVYVTADFECLKFILVGAFTRKEGRRLGNVTCMISLSLCSSAMMDFGWESHPCVAGASWLLNNSMSKMVTQTKAMGK